MGNWAIHIEGTGSHHNDLNPGDADHLARHLVDSLKEAGHQIESATFTSGAREEIKDGVNDD